MAAPSPDDKPRLGELVERARVFIVEDLWNLETRGKGLRGAALASVQFGVMVGRGFVRDRLLLRASALTYVTTLALIPMLAVMVGLMQFGRGGDELVKMVVGEMTAVSPAARDMILQQVAKADFGSLGTIGAAILVLTSILALRHLEMTLNAIWGVEDHRTWARRLSDYLTVLIVAPMLTGVALSVGAGLQGAALFSEFVDPTVVTRLEAQWIRMLPWLSLVVAFSFLYWFFPNTKVKPLAALWGGVVAAVLFSVARYFYVDLNVGVSKYNAIFGGFAALPLILAWIYACWAVVLFGAEVAFAAQNLTHYRRELRGAEPGMAERETIGLRIALEVGRSFRDGLGPTTADALSDRLDLPVRVVRESVRALQGAGLLEETSDEAGEVGLLPARPLTSISVADVFHGLRGNRDPAGRRSAASPSDLIDTAGAVHGRDLIVTRVVHEIDAAFDAVAGGSNLEDLLSARRAP